MATKKYKEKNNVLDCLKEPRINRILQLIELYKYGFTKTELYKTLNLKNDNGIDDALKQLEKFGLIKREYFKETQKITAIYEGKEEYSKLENIFLSDKKPRRAYILAKHPIEVIFNELKKDYGLNEESIIFLNNLEKEIKKLYNFYLYSINLNSKYNLFVKIDEMVNSLNELIEKANKEIIELEKTISPEELKQRKEFVQFFENHKKEIFKDAEKDKNKKIFNQNFYINLLKNCLNENNYESKIYETHVDYVINKLEMLILEEFIKHFSNYYNYIAIEKLPEINIKHLEGIEYLIYVLKTGDKKTKPELIKSGITGQLVDRLRNFNLNVDFATDQRRIKNTLNNPEQYKIELAKQKEKIKKLEEKLNY
jgi:hypothetical protein